MANNKSQWTWLEIEDCYNTGWATKTASASWEDPTKLTLQFWGVRYKLGLTSFPPKAQNFESITNPEALNDLSKCKVAMREVRYWHGWVAKEKGNQDKSRSFWKCIDVGGPTKGEVELSAFLNGPPTRTKCEAKCLNFREFHSIVWASVKWFCSRVRDMVGGGEQIKYIDSWEDPHSERRSTQHFKTISHEVA